MKTGGRFVPMALGLLVLVGLAAVPAQATSADKSPVDKVVSLLKELQSALDSDEKAEQSVYDKYACWCEETTARKAKAIEDAKAELKTLGQDILKLKGTVAIRTDEIAEKESEIKENEEAQESATSAREKENAAWQAESEETKEALAAINTAMGVLMKATKPALLQQDATARLQSTVSAAVAAAPATALAKLSPERLSQLRGFAASLAQEKGKAGYAPQSMTIQGILGDMYTTMGVDLMDATAAEAKKNRAFEDFMAEKDKELTKLKKILTKKQREKTEAEFMLSESTEAFDEVSKQLKADIEFFDVTKEACQDKTKDWQVRSDLRTDELKGVKEALKILESDEAKKMFEKSIKPGMETTFLQVDSTVHAPKQTKQVDVEGAYNKLKSRATRSHSLRLAALAAQVRMAKAGHFDKVIKSIDDLIVKLGKEQESDTKKRDKCEEQYQDITQESNKLKWMIKNNEAKIEKLKNLIKKREEEKKQTEKEIEDTKKDIKDMKAERKKENEAFIQAKKDDQAAIKLLEMAKEKLLEFYKKEGVKMGPIQGSVKLAVEPAAEQSAAPTDAQPIATLESGSQDIKVPVKSAPAAAKPAPATVQQSEKEQLTKPKETKTVAPAAAKPAPAAAKPAPAVAKPAESKTAAPPAAHVEKPVKATGKAAISLLQEAEEPKFEEDPDKAPDATFSKKGKRKNQSKGIVSIMTMLIEDLEAEIANGIKAEEAAQLSFEKALAAAEKLLEDLEAKKVSLEEAIAKRKKEKIAEEKDKEANEKDLEAQKKEKDSIKEDCDYIIKEYTKRREYRDAETEALRDAKEFLSTYFDDEESLVQQAAPAQSSLLSSFTRLASPELRN